MEDISLHILDVVGNAIRADATEVCIEIEEDEPGLTLSLRIRDNGCGMDEATARQVLDPFFTTRQNARVGLGLPLLRQAAEETGGSITVSSRLNEGTDVRAVFELRHPDMKPIGDVYGTLAALVAGHPSVRFLYRSRRGEERVDFDSASVTSGQTTS